MKARQFLRSQPVTEGGDRPSRDLIESIQRLVADGLTLEAAIPAAITADQSVSRVKLQFGVSATGTAVDFTGIPSWVNRITLQGTNISTSGTNRLLLRVGDGAIVASGYLGATTQIDGATPSTVNGTTGVLLTENNTSAMRLRFRATIERRAALVWVITGIGAFSNIATTTTFGSEITLGGALDRVRITTVVGTDTFGSGALAISWE